MTRTHRRISRALMIGLGGTIALGTVFWLGNLSARSAQRLESQRAEKAAAATQPVDRIAAQLAQNQTAPATLETPTTRPAVVTPPLLSAATTRPSEASVKSVAPTTKPSVANSAQVASATAKPPFGSEPQGPGQASSAAPLVDAKQKIDSAQLLEARKILNTALLSGSLSEADMKTARQMLGQINATVVFSSKRFPDDEYGGTFTVPPGAALAKIASTREITADLLMRINGITDARRLRAGQALKVLKGPFNAVIDKSDFTLELWLGEPGAKSSMYITTLMVGLGKDDSTPTGIWAVQNKLKNPAYYSPRGEGVIASDDPKNPLGEYWIGLTGTDGHAVGKQSYGVHGTIEPDSIGKQASMGCIRMRNEDVALVYEMLVEGKSTVTVKD